MNDQVERRIADQDPVDVLSPEVVALLRLCGGLRATDLQRAPEHRQPGAVACDRRQVDRRGRACGDARRAQNLLKDSQPLR